MSATTTTAGEVAGAEPSRADGTVASTRLPLTRAPVRDELALRDPAVGAADPPCARELDEGIDFAPRTAELEAAERGEVEKWASCLARPELEHATLVLVGVDDGNAGAELFSRRADVVREALAARGLPPSRVLVGGTTFVSDADRAGVSLDKVRVKVTSSATLRARAPHDVALPAARR